MIRSLHRWPGLIAATLLIVLALSGAVLSVLPALERVSAPQAAPDLTVADLTTRILASHPTVEQIKRSPSGKITAYWFDNGTPGAAIIDPATGLDAATADQSGFVLWMTDLHRALLMGDAGRWTTAAAAAALAVLSVTGAFLVARRMGGWRRWLARARGPLPGRLHLELTRAAVAGLMLSALTALWMTASTFSLLPDQGAAPVLPAQVSGQVGVDPMAVALLTRTLVADLRSLTFPYPDDPTDVFTLKTDAGIALFDQGTGAALAQTSLTGWERASEVIYMLHTGQGSLWATVLALILGAMALALPAMAVTGVLVWLAARRSRPRLQGNATAAAARTVVLVASEGGSTWGFAATLVSALRLGGHPVHVAPLMSFAPDSYRSAERIVIFAATYGEGEAPAAATGFASRFAARSRGRKLPIAVLGFGDRSFPHFCAFAGDIDTQVQAAGWPVFMALDTVDRQSAQDFARWGHALGRAIGQTVTLEHVPVAPPAQALTLTARQDFGDEVQAPTSILRFALPQSSLWQRLMARAFARFQAGDLLGILPTGSAIPRYYSLASSDSDGFVEICVRRHPGGLSSGQLLDLEIGGTVQGFVRRNPSFRPNPGRAPVILIGAGTGIGPLVGFIRANATKRPLHLFFGARHPASDLLYGSDLQDWSQQGRLTSLTTAFSRTPDHQYVQDALKRDAARVTALIAGGAQILVCGGRDMAAGVSAALTDILAPLGLTPAALKLARRYGEDVY